MKRNTANFFLNLLLSTLLSAYSLKAYSKANCGIASVISKFKTGDLIFQESLSAQSKTIQRVTHSEWSHVGILFYNDGHFTGLMKPKVKGWYVLEAIQPVSITPVSSWIRRGKGCKYVTTRLSKVLQMTLLDKFKSTKKTQDALLKAYSLYHGKAYDLLFQPEDDRIYCSELVGKVYKRLGVNLGHWVPIKSLDLNSLEFRKLKNRRLKAKAHYLGISPDELFEKGFVGVVKGNRLKIKAIQDKLVLTPESLMSDKRLSCVLGCSYL